ncbi:expressed unknown protein [Seminavis robusta]|uniref:Uncharacterized protein n=1 Tax=Seminavis robusta TaxID=568900 RepID=A0A9N8DSD3_9STRA|nr:expressed unknown protein [Seminavis robusta]|eukprot:Sro321_g116850.1 n/a (277) ;mRNA; r:64100-64930
MALVVQATSMNVSSTCSTVSTGSDEEDQDLLSLKTRQHVLLTDATTTSSTSTGSGKKRPLSNSTTSSVSSSVSTEDEEVDDGDDLKSPTKKQRTLVTKTVQFIPDPADESRVRTTSKEFEIDYDRTDIWWTNEESRAHMERQTSLLKLYANTCADLVDSVLLVWVNCAEEVMDDGNFCMTKEQRAQVAERVAESPVRGFEKELATDLITEQRIKTIGGILELQQLCYLNNVTPEERVDALAAASREFSKTATLFAKTLAQADAKGARDNCCTENET